MHRHDHTGRIGLVAGILIALLGAAVTAGVMPGLAAAPPIPFYSALGALLAAGALAAVTVGWTRMGYWAAIATASLGGLELVTDGIPPNAAACLLMGGIGLALLARGASPLWAALSGLVAMGAGALCGPLTGLATREWSRLNRMSVPGAVASILFGLGILGLALRRERERRAGSPPWLFAPVGLGVLLVAVMLWQAALAEQRRHAEAELESGTVRVYGQLLVEVERRIEALRRNARRMEWLPARPEPYWPADIELLYRDFPGYQALAWLDPDRVVRQVVPLAGNQVLLGRRLDFEPRRREALETALRDHAPRMSRPVDLLMGGRGVHVYVPVYRGGEPAGTVAGIFRVRDLLASALPPEVTLGLAVTVWEGNEALYTRATPPRGAGIRERALYWAGATWRLRVAALPHALGADARLPSLVLASGVLTAALLALSVHLAQSARRRSLAAERARAELSARVRQHRGLAELGQAALAGGSLPDLMNKLVGTVRDALAADCAKVLELQPRGEQLLLRAGVGWREGLVGQATVPAGLASQAGYTLAGGGPVVVGDLRQETRFSAPPWLHDSGVVSGLSVVITGRERPYGVLGAHTRAPRRFSSEDVGFLQAAAGLLASAIERERAERELDQFFTLSEDLLCVAGMDGYFQRVNPAFERWLGYSTEELLARPFLEFVHPEDRAATQQEIAHQRAGRSTLSFANRYRAKDGSYRWLHWNSTPAPARQVLFAAARDITALKQAEEALRRAHDELERRVEARTAELAQANRELVEEMSRRRQAQDERDRFFALSRDLIAVLDFDGRLRSVNPAWERTLGFPGPDLLGKSLLELVHPEDREEARRDLERLAAGEESLPLENRCRTREGRWRWLLWSSIAVVEEGRIYAAARDITEWRRAQQELREREEEFRRLFEEAPIGIALAGLDYHFQRANRAFCEMTGCSQEELCAMTWEDLTHPEDRERHRELVERLARGEIAAYVLEKRYTPRSGQELWLRMTGTVVLRPDGAAIGYLNMIENITGRVERDREIRKLNEQLRQRVEDLTAVNRELEAFTYSVSHDLRAPLRHMDGFSRLLLDSAPQLDETARHYLAQIRHGAHRMGVMVDELLNLSRVARHEPSRQLTGLRPLAEEAAEELRPEMRGREVEVRIGELPSAKCDPGLVRQVFQILLANAVKFTRPCGRAVIEVGYSSDAGRPPVIWVRDNGVGFSMKYAHKLFGVFQRLHRAEDFEGTGIGLATVQRIIQNHGGRVWAEGELGQGATFYFTLEPGEPWVAKAAGAR